MKMSEIRELSTPELNERVIDQGEYLNKLKLSHAISPLENPKKISDTKIEIARLKTELQYRIINNK